MIAEEFLLLSLDDETGKKKLSDEYVKPALGGALIIELALMERVGITAPEEGWRKRGRVKVISAQPTDDAELDRALTQLIEREGDKVKDLVSEMRGAKRRITKGLRERLLARLAAAGVLVEQPDTVLGFIPRTTWPTADAHPEDDLGARLQSALVGGATPTERTVALIALLHVTGLLSKVVHTEDKRALRRRAKELAEGDWAAQAVKDAIQEVMAAAAGGVVAASA